MSVAGDKAFFPHEHNFVDSCIYSRCRNAAGSIGPHQNCWLATPHHTIHRHVLCHVRVLDLASHLLQFAEYVEQGTPETATSTRKCGLHTTKTEGPYGTQSFCLKIYVFMTIVGQSWTQKLNRLFTTTMNLENQYQTFQNPKEC